MLDHTLLRSVRLFWTGSIRRQLMVGISLIYAVLMTLFILDLVTRQRAFLNEQGAAETSSLAGTLAANSASWVLANDVVGLEEVVQSLKNYPGVQYVMVLGTDGRVLAHTDAAYEGQYIADAVSLKMMGAEVTEQMLYRHGEIVDVAQPIKANGRHIGWARVAINHKNISENLNIVTRDGLVYTMLAIAVGIVFAYFMAKGLTSGLQQLVEVADKLRLGERDRRADIQRSDELGALGSAFNSMANTISNREAELQNTHDHLEETVRQRTEKLRETEAKTRQIVNSAVDGIITTDAQGTILSFNTAAEKIFGYSVIEVVGKNVTMLMPSNHAAKHGGYMDKYVAGGKGNVIGMGRELIALHKDGSKFLADFSISDFRHGDSITFVGIIRDITARKESEYKLQATLQELKNTQAELVQVEKMASLGGLVAGVAHEINTPIGVGLTAATHLKEQANELAQKFSSGQLKKSDFQAFIETAGQSTAMIYANLNRASDLIRSFKQVAVDQTSEEKRQINLLDYVDEVLESLKPNLKRTKHQIEVSGNRDIVLNTHPGAVSQILTNLVMNSIIHAYDDGDEGHIQISAAQNDTAVSMTYSDDGKGMDEDVCAKIFDPFFTTKRGSGGSGLGMHILYNQVTQTLGGSIDVHSTPGRGTAFEITIPLRQDDFHTGEV